MRFITGLALLITCVLFFGMQAIGQTTDTSPADTDAPQGASDDGGVFNAVWILVVAVAFVALVFLGLLARKGRKRGPGP